eukprot:scaffold287_cov337-Pavlova_lutheri.AAC.154
MDGAHAVHPCFNAWLVVLSIFLFEVHALGTGGSPLSSHVPWRRDHDPRMHSSSARGDLVAVGEERSRRRWSIVLHVSEAHWCDDGDAFDGTNDVHGSFGAGKEGTGPKDGRADPPTGPGAQRRSGGRGGAHAAHRAGLPCGGGHR